MNPASAHRDIEKFLDFGLTKDRLKVRMTDERNEDLIAALMAVVKNAGGQIVVKDARKKICSSDGILVNWDDLTGDLIVTVQGAGLIKV